MLEHRDRTPEGNQSDPETDLQAAQSIPAFAAEQFHELVVGAESDPQLVHPGIFIARFSALEDFGVENIHFFHFSAVEPGSSDIHVLLVNGAAVDLFGVRGESAMLDPELLRATIRTGVRLEFAELEDGGKLVMQLTPVLFDTPLRLYCHSARVLSSEESQ